MLAPQFLSRNKIDCNSRNMKRREMIYAIEKKSLDESKHEEHGKNREVWGRFSESALMHISADVPVTVIM